MTAKTAIAEAADQMIRDRYDQGFEILFDRKRHTFVLAKPRNAAELTRPDQPTAVFLGCAENFENAEQLYREALHFTDEVDRLAETAEEW